MLWKRAEQSSLKIIHAEEREREGCHGKPNIGETTNFQEKDKKTTNSTWLSWTSQLLDYYLLSLIFLCFLLRRRKQNKEIFLQMKRTSPNSTRIDPKELFTSGLILWSRQFLLNVDRVVFWIILDFVSQKRNFFFILNPTVQNNLAHGLWLTSTRKSTQWNNRFSRSASDKIFFSLFCNTNSWN